MFDRISAFLARLTKDELNDIQQYIHILRGHAYGQMQPTADPMRLFLYKKHIANINNIPRWLAEFLVKDCEDYEPEIWFMLPPDMGPSFRETIALLVKDYGSGKICREAGISRRIYYKIFDSAYLPSKDVIMRIAMAKRLSLGETHVLLNRADYTIDKFCDRDLILDYCFQQGWTDIVLVNDALRRLGQRPLARK